MAAAAASANRRSPPRPRQPGSPAPAKAANSIRHAAADAHQHAGEHAGAARRPAARRGSSASAIGNGCGPLGYAIARIAAPHAASDQPRRRRRAARARRRAARPSRRRARARSATSAATARTARAAPPAGTAGRADRTTRSRGRAPGRAAIRSTACSISPSSLGWMPVQRRDARDHQPRDEQRGQDRGGAARPLTLCAMPSEPDLDALRAEALAAVRALRGAPRSSAERAVRAGRDAGPRRRQGDRRAGAARARRRGARRLADRGALRRSTSAPGSRRSIERPHVALVGSGSQANLLAVAAVALAPARAPAAAPATRSSRPPSASRPRSRRSTSTGCGRSTSTSSPTPTTRRSRRSPSAIGPRTRGILAAHCLGNPFDAPGVEALCREHDLVLIEDCCDALGSRIGGRRPAPSATPRPTRSIPPTT